MALAACVSIDGDSAGGFGATQGGVQDMGLARELIANGIVPHPEAFPVEGMFSEHELGIVGPSCAHRLCLRVALGVALTLDGEPSGWVQIGMSSTIDPERFERPSLTLVLTVDVSGSMGWDYSGDESEYTTPGSLSRALLHQLASQLDERDRVAIVTYGSSVSTLLPFTSGADQSAIHGVIDDLATNGSTNMEGGLRRAYELARTADAGTDDVRVMLFTDVRPNVGATTATEFDAIVTGGVDDGTSLTVFGLGLGLGQEVFTAMSGLRGGNGFSLFDADDVEELMGDDWPWLVSPIAYDMSMSLAPSAGFTIADSYGFPARDDGEIALDVATVFLSKRKGALLLRLAPLAADLSGLRLDGDLAYWTPEGQLVEDSVVAAYGDQPLDVRGQYFQQDAVAKTVALAVLVSNMRIAAERYGVNQADGAEHMRATYERFLADSESIDDAALAPEVILAADLLELMENAAPQSDPYGAY